MTEPVCREVEEEECHDETKEVVTQTTENVCRAEYVEQCYDVTEEFNCKVEYDYDPSVDCVEVSQSVFNFVLL